MTAKSKLLLLGLAASLTPLAGCSSAVSPSQVGEAGSAKPPVDLGGPLYPPKPMPAIPPTTPVGESTAIPATISSEVREQVPALVDGALEILGTPVTPDSVRPGDPDIIYHPRDLDHSQPYRRLREGDTVRVNQTLGRIDEQAVAIQRMTAEKTIALSKATAAAASEGEKKQNLLTDKIRAARASEAEVLQQESLGIRYVENRLNAERDMVKAEGEYMAAENQLKKHWIRSPINGRVTRLVKAKAEYARAGDTVLEIESTDRVRVEGKLDASLADRVKRGMRVIVEPARPAGPDAHSNSHRQDVTDVAVTGHAGRPMIVSAGLDSSALVWDVTATKASHRLPHPAGVRSVACTLPGVKKQLVVTGADDGGVRVWDVSNPDKLPTNSDALPEPHPAGVAVVAISPDGRFVASASGREVVIHSLADKRRLYALPADHRDSVTALAFTPQGTLVTAARDRVIRVYKLGDRGATATTVMEHRGGAVDAIGVSADGSRVVFDKDGSRLDLVSLGDERTVGTVETAGGSARFATLAEFGPGDEMIVTASGEPDRGGELTIWQAPKPGGRAAERRRLAAPRGAAITAAAFSPDPKHRFVCAGTSSGAVYFWPLTGEGAGGKVLVGEVTSIAPDDAKTVTVRVELTNPLDANGDGLADRSQATIIVPPEGVQLPAPAAPTPPPAAPAVGPSVNAPNQTPVTPVSASVPAANDLSRPTPLPKGVMPAIELPPRR